MAPPYLAKGVKNESIQEVGTSGQVFNLFGIAGQDPGNTVSWNKSLRITEGISK